MDYTEIKKEIRDITLDLLSVVSVGDHDYTHQPLTAEIEYELKEARQALDNLIKKL